MSDQRADKLGELWDVYTRQRQLTGRTHRRGEALAQGEYHMVANALVFNQDGELLVQQRSFKKMALPGGWVLATGGSVLQGETSLEGIQREVVEELGAQATHFERIRTSWEKDWFDDLYVTRINQPLDSLKIQTSEVETASRGGEFSIFRTSFCKSTITPCTRVRSSCSSRNSESVSFL